MSLTSKSFQRPDHSGGVGKPAPSARVAAVRNEDAAIRHVGIGIDTARYGHHVSFLKEDKQPAAPPLPITESRAGYEQLQQRLEELRRKHPAAHLHLRIDAAGQYAVNLERFVRSLTQLPMTVSRG